MPTKVSRYLLIIPYDKLATLAMAMILDEKIPMTSVRAVLDGKSEKPVGWAVRIKTRREQTEVEALLEKLQKIGTISVFTQTNKQT